MEEPAREEPALPPSGARALAVHAAAPVIVVFSNEGAAAGALAGLAAEVLWDAMGEKAPPEWKNSLIPPGGEAKAALGGSGRWESCPSVIVAAESDPILATPPAAFPAVAVEDEGMADAGRVLAAPDVAASGACRDAVTFDKEPCWW